jgi:hypothetical protein
MTIKKIFLLNIFFVFAYSLSKSFNNIVPSILKSKKIYNELSTIIQEQKYDTYILNGPSFNSPFLKKDITRIIFQNNLINFEELSFNEYVVKTPNLYCQNTAFFINDYLINYGRILNDEEKITIMKKNFNYVFLNVNDINFIPIKDNNFNRQFKLLDFPIIFKKDIIHYIYEFGEFKAYSDYLYSINWNNYDLDRLTFNDIEILLNKIEKYFLKIHSYSTVNQDNLNKYIHSVINILIKNNSLKYR